MKKWVRVNGLMYSQILTVLRQRERFWWQMSMPLAQQMDAVKTALRNYKTELVNVPPGCTSRIQPSRCLH